MFASFHAFYRVDVVIHMLSACIDVVIHIALCMHRCGHPHGNAMLMWSSTCAYKFAFCFAPCIQVDKEEIASDRSCWFVVARAGHASEWTEDLERLEEGSGQLGGVSE